MILSLLLTACLGVPHGISLPGSDTDESILPGDTGTGADTSETGDTADTSDTSDSGTDSGTDSGDSGDTGVDTGPTAQELCEERRGCDGKVATWCNSDWSVDSTTCTESQECVTDSYGNGGCEETAVEVPTDGVVTYIYDAGETVDLLTGMYEKGSTWAAAHNGWDDSDSEIFSSSITLTTAVEDGDYVRFNVAVNDGTSTWWSCNGSGTSDDLAASTVSYTNYAGTTCAPAFHFWDKDGVGGCELVIRASCSVDLDESVF